MSVGDDAANQLRLSINDVEDVRLAQHFGRHQRRRDDLDDPSVITVLVKGTGVLI